MFVSVIKAFKKKSWVRFLLYAALMYGFFLLFYKVLREIELINTLYVDALNQFAIFLIEASELSLNLFGIETVSFGKTLEVLDDFTNRGIYLDRGCMGRNIKLAFIGVILIAPGKIKHKLWYIPAGLAVIVLINIIRIAGLAYIGYKYPQHMDINHYVVFRAVAWTAIFLMWGIWFNRFSGLNKKTTQKRNITS